MDKDLQVGDIISNSMSKGVKNLIPIAVNAVLWLLTVWIPYINIGTTIGLSVGLPAKAGRDENISPTEIFNPVYRKQMGEYVLVSGLVNAGVGIGFALFIIPGIVISIAWLLAPLFVVDKQINPLEAINRSNSVTYGKKWTIFRAYLVIGIVIAIVIAILTAVLGLISSFLATLVGIIAAAFAASFLISASGYIYISLGGE